MGNITGLMTLVFWIVRGIILGTGIVPGILQMVEGKRDDDDRQFKKGLSLIIIVVVVVAASIPLESFVKQNMGSAPTVAITDFNVML